MWAYARVCVCDFGTEWAGADGAPAHGGGLVVALCVQELPPLGGGIHQDVIRVHTDVQHVLRPARANERLGGIWGWDLYFMAPSG